jgi:pimeloyl-ACP methyl ester carboxylesterase
MMQGSLLSYQYQHFAPRYRMVLVDPPGVGKSDPLRKQITIEDSGEVLINILDALSIEKCIFGGNSWGAMLAVVFPAWHPERVIAVIAMNTTASAPDTAETVKMSIGTRLLYMNGTMPKWWVSFAKTGFAGETATETNPERSPAWISSMNIDPSAPKRVTRAEPVSIYAHSSAVCQCSSRKAPLSIRMFTPAISVERGISRCVT